MALSTVSASFNQLTQLPVYNTPPSHPSDPKPRASKYFLMTIVVAPLTNVTIVDESHLLVKGTKDVPFSPLYICLLSIELIAHCLTKSINYSVKFDASSIFIRDM